ncbi:hypothetical protein [uncultured Sphingobium sp.]|uniref:hypothetical protein n=1 Tax=uncultured Sphingobium sp. TaxID=316087 RepID=UPI002621E0B4|nr:hypothetical protein [uncultured Sphingobium sp.]
MRNFALEGEIAAQSLHLVGSLSYWRTLPAPTFHQHRRVVETSVASIVSVSRLAPDNLIAEMTYAVEEERIAVWNDLCLRFSSIDRMTGGIAAEISGSCAALSAAEVDPLGMVLLLNRLSQPFVAADLDQRVGVAASWLAAHGTILNPTTLAEVDWDQSYREVQSYDDSEGAPWDGAE